MEAAPFAHAQTLTAEIARTIVDDVHALGVPLDDVLARLDVPPGALDDVDGRIPAELAVRLWERAALLVDDPCFGLHLGERAASRSFALVAYIFEACDTVGDGIERLLRVQRALNDVHRAELVRGEGVASLRVRTRHTPLPVPPQAIDFAFAWMVAVSRRATGRDQAPTRVRFEHPAPDDDGREYRRVFGCSVEFDAEQNELTFPTEALTLPLKAPDPALRAILESHARILVERLPARPTFAARVADALVPLLPAGPTVKDVARALRLSARSVQRYLQGEATSFADVLDGVRHRHAEVALRDPSRSIAQVSASLGFADQSAFHRAFVRWTGTTPGSYRRDSREATRRRAAAS